MSEEYKFKCLLEYFVAHLEYAENGMSDTIGFNRYLKDIVDTSNFKISGYGWKGQQIQLQVAAWEDFHCGKICINVDARGHQTKSCYLNWKGTGINITPFWNEDHIHDLQILIYTEEDGGRWDSICSYPLASLSLFDERNTVNASLKQLFKEYCAYKEAYNEQITKKGMVNQDTLRAAKLLENSGQIILQGAPGCGKTYITTELAVYLCDGEVPSTREELKKRYKELQKEGRVEFTTFHQSLDYEEFVEGLKPDTDSLNDKEMRFVVKSGIFKRICQAASATTTSNLKEAYNSFAEDVVNYDDIYKINMPNGSMFGVTINGKGNLSLYTGKDFKLNGTLTYENIEKFFYGADLGYWKCYFKGIIDVLKKDYKLAAENKDANKPYVLVIDEINRANVSKVLGELITLLEKNKRLGGEDEFTVTLPYSGENFGVPDNLYIIGTMNTADRSLGYIDYAVRRRFAFMTIEAKSDVIREFYNGNGELMKKELLLFTSVSDLIKDNLNPDFDLNNIMVGHSYFLAKSDDDFELNLEYKIRPLLEEYLRDGIIVDNGEIKASIANLGK
ncbi:McrB family protein [Leyella stercorea]|jgi:5-methylcytosine-specific restriction protein B|uniref:McrB family protein n=1 Tax=Leyella stercorea TaxID=363265 RepID=UPI003AAF02A0